MEEKKFKTLGEIYNDIAVCVGLVLLVLVMSFFLALSLPQADKLLLKVIMAGIVVAVLVAGFSAIMAMHYCGKYDDLKEKADN